MTSDEIRLVLAVILVIGAKMAVVSACLGCFGMAVVQVLGGL